MGSGRGKTRRLQSTSGMFRDMRRVYAASAAERLHPKDGRFRRGGMTTWWKDDAMHRVDGPAIEFANGRTEWWYEGRLHREDGPAKEWPDGGEEWWNHGMQHRTDGPAVVNYDGSYEYWLNGKLVSDEVFQALQRDIEKDEKLERLSEVKLGAPEKVTF